MSNNDKDKNAANYDILQFELKLLLSGLCRGKATVAYKKPQRRKKEESKRLRRERDQIKVIDIRFKRVQVAGFRR